MNTKPEARSQKPEARKRIAPAARRVSRPFWLPTSGFWLLLLAFLVLAIQVGTGRAQTRPGIHPFVTPPEGCYVSDAVQPEDVYSFLRVQILALSLAHRGERANSAMLETTGGASYEKIDKTIAGLREELTENTCASFVVSYYIGSKDSNIDTIAKVLASAYDDFGKMSNEMLGISLQESLRDVNRSQRQLSILLEKRQATLRDMKDALNLTLGLLIDYGHTNTEGKPDHLILSRAQIRGLLDFLYARFPALKDSQGATASGDFAKQAALIKVFLSSGYRPADSP